MAIHWIKAKDIEEWTEREPRRAQEVLPELIERLILASSDSILDFHFPHDKAIQFAGYDGYLNTQKGSLFFPEGISVWECGTNKDILSKFNFDYLKRSEKPGEIDKEQTEYYFVTSRIWNHQTSIADRTLTAKKESNWKNVRILDAMNLEVWLEQCPSVTIWFSELIGFIITGFIPLENYWKSICENTDPILTTEFFMYGRKSFALEIVDLFDKNIKQVIICSDSLLESIIVLASDLMSSSEFRIKSFLEKCVIVQNESIWIDLSTKYHDNAIFIFGFHPTNITNMSNNKCIFTTNINSPFDQRNKSYNRIVIERQKKSDFENALKNMGCSYEKIYTLSFNSKRKFTALLRQITKDPLMRSPTWTSSGDLNILIPVLMTGGWNTNMPGDISVLEKLSKMKWYDYIKSLNAFTTGVDSPVFCVGVSWMCVSIPEVWDVLWNYITTHDFDIFKQCIIDVFTTRDPTYELQPEQWFAGSIYGKKHIYSTTLLNGLLISLIQFSERNYLDNQFSIISTTIAINNIVQQILDSIFDRQGWYTIAPYFPLLSEASPEIVLLKLEEKSESNDDDFWSMFNPPHDILTGRTFYTHIIWALENLTWMPEYSTRAIHVLALFSEKQFDYKLTNCPSESLYRIFCLWSPQGCLKSHMDLLFVIIKKYPYTARLLITSLLSEHANYTTNISKPIWREIDNNDYKISTKEYYENKYQIADLFISIIKPIFKDWKIVFDSFSSFAHNNDHLISVCKTQSKLMCVEDLLKLCQQIAEYISNNRKFVDANWSMQEKYLSKLEILLNDITPNSPKKYHYYFNWNFNGLHPKKYDENTYDYKIEEQDKLDFRREAISDILLTYGRESIIEVIETAEDTSHLGLIIIEDILANKCDWSFIKNVLIKNERVASSVILQLFYKIGLNNILLELPITDIPLSVFILTNIPISMDVINFIESTNSSFIRLYWDTINLNMINIKDNDLTTRVIKNMLNYNRPYTLIDFIAYTEYNDLNILLEILEKAVDLYPDIEVGGKSLNSIPHYDIEEIFTKIYNKKEIYSDRIAKLELIFLFTFDYEFEPQCLIDKLLHDSELFMEFVSYVYKQDIVNTSNISIDENKKRHIYEVLRRIKRIPGATGNTVDNDVFMDWINKVETLSNSLSYRTAFEFIIGTILSYSPVGSDGIWPCECVRNYLENNNSQRLVQHIISGVCNQRGVYTASAGIAEANIAEKYLSFSRKLEYLHPKTAAVVRKLSEIYKYDSKQEEQREMIDFN